MAKQASARTGTSEGPQTLLVPIISEHETAQEFSAVIIPFTTGELAQAAKRGKEAAKKWKEGRSLPSAWSMMNMAREIPAVRNYMLAKLGLGAHFNFNSPQGLDALARAVGLISSMPGPDGDSIRDLLSGKRGRE